MAFRFLCPIDALNEASCGYFISFYLMGGKIFSSYSLSILSGNFLFVEQFTWPGLGRDFTRKF